jgi:hypothetical protein
VAALTLTILTAWSLAVLLHWWPRLSAPLRRRVSIATNVAALGFLVAALRAEGLRESAMTSVVLVGAAYHTATASALASYYYYVLTATCLLLGFAGLTLGDALAAFLAERPLLSSVAVAWLVTLLRFLLEKSAAPAPLAQAVGVAWLAPVAGAYLATVLRPQQTGWRAFLKALTIYALLVRGVVALASVAATRLGLGSHYDVSPLTTVPMVLSGAARSFSPASWEQLLWLTLVPQLVAWPLFTVLVGMLAGAITARFAPPSDPSRTRASVSGPVPLAGGG